MESSSSAVKASMWDHCGTLHSNELRVPMLVRIKGGRVAAAALVGDPVSTLDVLPTFADYAGIDTAQMNLDGISLRSRPSSRIITSVYNRQRSRHNRYWKLYWSNDREVSRLARLSSDGEREVATEKYPEVVRRLTPSKWRERDEDVSAKTSAILEELRSIGYVE